MKLADLRKHYEQSRAVRPATASTTASRSPARNPREVLDGEVLALRDTSSFSRELTYPYGWQHGRHRLGPTELLGDGQVLFTSSDGSGDVDFTQAVFLDTETTGLGMGTGTYVFLVGAGYFEGRDFRVRQFFLHSPHEEAIFLDELGSFLERFSALVTFNGRAFDWPLIQQRFVRHRRPPPLDVSHHIDLLYIARRLWRRRLESCGLSSLELSILEVARTEQDVPGFEIPYRYFRYQRTGDLAHLAGVFYHNLQDILSMGTLALHVSSVIRDPSCGLVDHPVDFLSVGRLLEVKGLSAKGLECYTLAMERALSDAHRQEALYRRSLLRKRAGDWTSAEMDWRGLRQTEGPYTLTALVEMAKYYEHVVRDFHEALRCVDEALSLVRLGRPGWGETGEPALEYRRARILRKYRSSASSRHPELQSA